MKQKILSLVFASFLGGTALSACNGGSNGQDDEQDGNGLGDAQPQGDASSSSAWPCQQSDPNKAQLRLTALEISTPAALNNLGALIFEPAINDFTFLWLLELDLTANTLTTGAGARKDAPPSPSEAGFCQVSWHAESTTYPPSSGVPITVNTEQKTFSTSQPIPQLTSPIYNNADGSHLLDLTFYQLEILNISYNDDWTLCGQPDPEVVDNKYAQDWQTTGTFSGWIGWDQAMQTPIQGIPGTSLCTILCGANCEQVANPETDCTGSRPAQIPGTDDMLGFAFTASIGAGAVNIQ